ncbi:MAG: hypothetical protein AB1476_06765 [Candidatus Hadarchaeota archaeon]
MALRMIGSMLFVLGCVAVWLSFLAPHIDVIDLTWVGEPYRAWLIGAGLVVAGLCVFAAAVWLSDAWNFRVPPPYSSNTDYAKFFTSAVIITVFGWALVNYSGFTLEQGTARIYELNADPGKYENQQVTVIAYVWTTTDSKTIARDINTASFTYLENVPKNFSASGDKYRIAGNVVTFSETDSSNYNRVGSVIRVTKIEMLRYG